MLTDATMYRQLCTCTYHAFPSAHKAFVIVGITVSIREHGKPLSTTPRKIQNTAAIPYDAVVRFIDLVRWLKPTIARPLITPIHPNP
jgi:hypothetical protein